MLMHGITGSGPLAPANVGSWYWYPSIDLAFENHFFSFLTKEKTAHRYLPEPLLSEGHFCFSYFFLESTLSTSGEGENIASLGVNI